jgi:hypothetical protein
MSGGWITANHKAPVDRMVLIALSTGKVLTGVRLSGAGWDWPEQDEDEDNLASVTHWQEMPAPPTKPGN